MRTDSVSSHQKDQEHGRLITNYHPLVDMAAYVEEVDIPDDDGEERVFW